MKRIHSMASSLSLAVLSVGIASADAILRVQTTTNVSGTLVQDGWTVVDGSRDLGPISSVVGGVTVSLSNTYGRSSADGRPVVNLTDGDLDNLLSGGRLINFSGSFTLTLAGLADGDYSITTYHHTTYPQTSGLWGSGHVFDVSLTDATRTNALVADDVPASWSGSGTDAAITMAEVSKVVTAFTVSGGNAVTLKFATGAGFTGNTDNLFLNGFEVESAAGGNSFSDWIVGKPGVGGQTGLNDDPDGDGIDNGVENFFGTEPGAFSQGLVTGTMSGNTFTFTHPQGTLADDLTATYRWSTDLAGFFADGISNNGTTVDFTTESDTPEAGFTRVTATISGTPLDKLFVDVEVLQN